MKKTGAAATVLVLGIVLINSCGGTEAPESDVPPRSYDMRGMVRRISDPGAEERQIWIHHEAISEFVDIRGNSAPMDAMTMPFHLVESIDLEGIEPGTKVSFRLDVDWNSGVPARIASVEILPSETRLEFEEGDGESLPEEPAEHGDH